MQLLKGCVIILYLAEEQVLISAFLLSYKSLSLSGFKRYAIALKLVPEVLPCLTSANSPRWRFAAYSGCRFNVYLMFIYSVITSA